MGLVNNNPHSGSNLVCGDLKIHFSIVKSTHRIKHSTQKVLKENYRKIKA
jgi:hypothetical protein